MNSNPNTDAHVNPPASEFSQPQTADELDRHTIHLAVGADWRLEIELGDGQDPNLSQFNLMEIAYQRMVEAGMTVDQVFAVAYEILTDEEATFEECLWLHLKLAICPPDTAEGQAFRAALTRAMREQVVEVFCWQGVEGEWCFEVLHRSRAVVRVWLADGHLELSYSEPGRPAYAEAVLPFLHHPYIQQLEEMVRHPEWPPASRNVLVDFVLVPSGLAGHFIVQGADS